MSCCTVIPLPNARRNTFDTRSSANAEDSAAVAEILKGICKYLEAFLAQGYAYFSSGCGFLVGLGKLKLCTKFEVASFSHCVNIERNPQILGSTLAQAHAYPFFCVWFYHGLWQTLDACQI